MAYKITLRPLAESELEDAIDWHNEQLSGLGFAFLVEVEKVFADIKESPNLYQKRYKDVRIRFTQRFRYGIHYTITDKIIVVHAIWHTSRKPRKRLKP